MILGWTAVLPFKNFWILQLHKSRWHRGAIHKALIREQLIGVVEIESAWVYASSLSSGGNGEPGECDDTPSTNMFEGTWIALTSETYIGQGLGWVTAVADGEFAFSSKFK